MRLELPFFMFHTSFCSLFSHPKVITPPLALPEYLMNLNLVGCALCYLCFMFFVVLQCQVPQLSIKIVLFNIPLSCLLCLLIPFLCNGKWSVHTTGRPSAFWASKRPSIFHFCHELGTAARLNWAQQPSSSILRFLFQLIPDLMLP